MAPESACRGDSQSDNLTRKRGGTLLSSSITFRLRSVTAFATYRFPAAKSMLSIDTYRNKWRHTAATKSMKTLIIIAAASATTFNEVVAHQ
ncbi:hypothetical protein Y032_0117g703 [Ancylostoma ceylanicum]|uniref:Uncharacterized protein n=1 Tax=Ancylostoma ceylanicum TaxID=53326 RepID=A0A016TCA3_9BILA|nr:hypothetical protein Y032_0117g703 [Ancylostoma ceylanicum]